MAEPAVQTPQTETAPAQDHKTWASAWATAMSQADDAEPAEAGSEQDAGDGAEPEATEAAGDGDGAKAQAEPESKQAEPDESEGPAAGGAESDEFMRLAKKLGYVVDGREVSLSDRAQLRAEKRKWHENRLAQERQFKQNLDAAMKHLAPLAAAREAWESGDYDGALEKAFGIDISKLNEQYANRLRNRDPRVDKLEKELAAAREREAQREEMERKYEMERQREQARANYARTVASELSGSGIEGAKDLSSHASFVNLVIAKQEEHWDGSETISAGDAAELVLADLRDEYELLHKVFGDRGASIPEGQSASAGAVRGSGIHERKGNGKKPPTTLNQRRAAEASPPGGKLDERAWMKKFASMMRQASD